MIAIADKSTEVKPLVQTPIAKVFPVALASDGGVLRARLRFDEPVERVVGLNVDIDLAFMLENPNPTTLFLKREV